jgi:hypothetical protein
MGLESGVESFQAIRVKGDIVVYEHEVRTLGQRCTGIARLSIATVILVCVSQRERKGQFQDLSCVIYTAIVYHNHLKAVCRQVLAFQATEGAQ